MIAFCLCCGLVDKAVGADKKAAHMKQTGPI